MIRGWCPSLWEPMPTGDGLLVRVKPPGGALDAHALRFLADAAARFGNGTVELTARANLQIRGLTAATTGLFAAAMVELGLAHPDRAVERRRTILCAPFASPNARAVAADLEAALVADTALASLPAKFGFSVGASEHLPGDIHLRVGKRCEVSLDGGKHAAHVPVDRAVATAIGLAHAFLGTGASRMRDAVAAADALFAACGLTPVSRTKPSPAPKIIGFLPEARAFGVGLPFGATTADHLNLLADAADRSGGLIRLTPWRVILLIDVKQPITSKLPFITDPADPRLRIAACPGGPACTSGSVDTRPLAQALAQLQVPDHIHVSGCAKGCAHPGPAAITLVGREGAFDLVRNGRATDPPALSGLTAAELLAALHPADAIA